MKSYWLINNDYKQTYVLGTTFFIFNEINSFIYKYIDTINY